DGIRDLTVTGVQTCALPILATLEVKGMVHIKGGGLVENVPRVLAENLTAVLDSSSWTMPPLFHWLQQHGGVADAEMHRVFNCGKIGRASCRERVERRLGASV